MVERGVRVNDKVGVVVEVMLNDEPHPRPLVTLPIIGGWTDWKAARSVGLRLEWQSSAGQHFVHISRGKLESVKEDDSVLSPYVRTSAIAAAFKNISYRNPQPWRINEHLRIKELSFNHFDQAFEFKDLLETTVLDAPTLKTRTEMVTELNNIGMNTARKDTVPPFLLRGAYYGWCDHCYSRRRYLAGSDTSRQPCDRQSPCNNCVRDQKACAYSPETGLVHPRGLRLKDGTRPFCDTCWLVSNLNGHTYKLMLTMS